MRYVVKEHVPILFKIGNNKVTSISEFWCEIIMSHMMNSTKRKYTIEHNLNIAVAFCMFPLSWTNLQQCLIRTRYKHKPWISVQDLSVHHFRNENMHQRACKQEFSKLAHNTNLINQTFI